MGECVDLINQCRTLVYTDDLVKQNSFKPLL